MSSVFFMPQGNSASGGLTKAEVEKITHEYVEKETPIAIKAVAISLTTGVAGEVSLTEAPKPELFDGVNVEEKQLVLLTAQTNKARNGIWEYLGGKLVRPTVFAANSSVVNTVVTVLEGNFAGGSFWTLQGEKLTVETSNQTWIENSAAGGGAVATVPEAFIKPEELTITTSTESLACTEAVLHQRQLLEAIGGGSGNAPGEPQEGGTPHGIALLLAVPEVRHPLVKTDGTDPLWTLVVEAGGKAIPGTVSGTTKILAPPGLEVAAGGDRHLSVLQPNGFFYDFWKTTIESVAKTITYRFGGKYSATGSGCEGRGGESSATQSGLALAAGAITAQELYAHKIDHALFITVGWCAKAGSLTYGSVLGAGNPVKSAAGAGTNNEASYVYPATGGGRESKEIVEFEAGKYYKFNFSTVAGPAWEHMPPFGARCRLNMSVAEILSKKYALWKQTILIALSEYGGFIGDTGGKGFEIHFEDPVSYTMKGQPNPFVEYHLKYHPGVTNEVRENELERKTSTAVGATEFEADTTNESNILKNVTSMSKVKVGNVVTGTNIPNGTTVTEIKGTTEIKMSAKATGTTAKVKVNMPLLVFNFYENTLKEGGTGTVGIPWEKLEWVMPPPASIKAVGVRQRPLTGRFFSPLSPINVPLRPTWEGTGTTVLPALPTEVG